MASVLLVLGLQLRLGVHSHLLLVEVSLEVAALLEELFDLFVVEVGRQDPLSNRVHNRHHNLFGNTCRQHAPKSLLYLQCYIHKSNNSTKENYHPAYTDLHISLA